MKKRGLNQTVILHAAAELAEQKGLENITLRELADTLEVKSASLYNHIHGMPELAAKLAQLALSRLEGQLRDAAVGRSKADALMAIARAYRKFAQQSPELYKAILYLPKLEDDQLNESGRAVMQILYQVLEQYDLTREETLHFSRGFRSAMHGFVSLETADFFLRRVDIDESYEQLIQHLISTLADRPAAQPEEKEELSCR